MRPMLEHKFFLLLISILMPYGIGVLLSDLAGIDISSFMKSIFSILQSIELVGYPIQTKSMILFFVFVFLPLSLFLCKQAIKNDPAAIADQNVSSFKLLFISLIGLILSLVMVYLYIGGIDIASRVRDGVVQPGMRLFLSTITSDFKFSLFSSGVAFFVCIMFCGVHNLIKAVFIRLKK